MMSLYDVDNNDSTFRFKHPRLRKIKMQQNDFAYYMSQSELNRLMYVTKLNKKTDSTLIQLNYISINLHLNILSLFMPTCYIHMH